MKKIQTPIKSNRKTNISDYVVTVLRERIVQGDILAGEELNQVEIANQLGVSRIPVREAFRQLASEGLIQISPNRQAVVTRVDIQTLEEIFEVRIALENLALCHAIDRMQQSDLDHLYTIIEELEQAPDHEQWMRLNQVFHDTLYSHSGKGFLCDQIKKMRANTERYMWKSSTSVYRNKEANLEHRKILLQCEKKDKEAAMLDLKLHLQGTFQGLKRTLEQKQSQSE